ncbi:MAG: class I SAM-dependent methyltransferase [Endozoicomonas sp.]
MIKRIMGLAHLTLLALLVNAREWREALQICRSYFSSWQFARAFLWLKLLYLVDDPYRVSRRYCKQQGEADCYQYGETPLTTLHSIMERVMTRFGGNNGELLDCHVFELGAGSGFTSIWLNSVLGCRVTAIDQVPAFCRRLAGTARRFGLEGIEARCEDYLQADLSGATIVYLYGSNLDDPVIRQLADRLAELPSGTIVISVSYSLLSYIPEAFKLSEQFPAQFFWGEAEVFIQQVCAREEVTSQAKTSGERIEVC